MINHERLTSTSIGLEKTDRCSYCREETIVQLPPGYEPVFMNCIVCGHRFIAERTKNGLDVLL